MKGVTSKIRLKWVVPLAICYSAVGLFIYAAITLPEIHRICAIGILTTVLLTMTIILIYK